VAAALGPVGVPTGAVEVVTADATDAAAMAEALAGADACVHAAAVFTWDQRRDAEISATNLAATRTVLEAALAAGCDPVVHVSSIVAILPERPGDPVDADSPVYAGRSPGAYVRSKSDSELLARSLQAEGAPVVSVYPGAVAGPHDPNLGELATALRWYLRGLLPTMPKGRYWFTDVRDVAAVIERSLSPARGPRRFVVPGTGAAVAAAFRIARESTGRRLPIVELPSAVLSPLTAGIRLAQHPLPGTLRYPADPAAVWTAARDPHVDATATTAQLGVHARPLRTSIEDEVRWLAGAGLITARQAGRLAAGS
jgi:nucleoside-diphosphate-sugar epimerase